MFQLMICLLLGSAPARSQAARDIVGLPASGPIGPARNVALVIGVEQYDDPVINDLSYSEDDAIAVAGTLVESGDYASDDVLILSTGLTTSLQPTLRNIYEQLGRLAARGPVGTVLVFFSGHGVVSGENGARELFVLPSDTLLSNPYKTGVRVQDILDAMERVPAQARVAVFDACRSAVRGGDRGVEEAAPPPDRVPSLPGIYILYSTSWGEVSIELTERQRSLLGGAPGRGAFTYYLEQGLRGSADGTGGTADGVITATELYTYAAAGLSRLPEAQVRQVPRATCQECGNDMDLPVVRRRNLGSLQVGTAIPSSLVDIQAALQAARAAFDQDDGLGFLEAAHLAERRVSGAAEALTPEMAADWHRVEALRAWRLKDHSATRLALAAAYNAAPWQAPGFGLPTSEPGLLTLAVSPPAGGPDVAFYDTPGIHFIIDGQISNHMPTWRPSVVQAETCTGELRATMVMKAGDPTPAVAGLHPLPLPCRWEAARPLAIGAGTSLAVAGALLAGALVTEEAYNESSPSGGPPGPDDALARRANVLGYAAQGGVAVALGFGVATLVRLVSD